MRKVRVQDPEGARAGPQLLGDAWCWAWSAGLLELGRGALVIRALASVSLSCHLVSLSHIINERRGL